MQKKPVPTPEDPDKETGRGRDNYFNHSICTLGYTHYQHMMGTPLFVPVIGADGISKGFRDTRVWMHHLGISGILGNGIYWKTLTTWSRDFGSYYNVLPEPLDEISFLAEGSYNGAKL